MRTPANGTVKKTMLILIIWFIGIALVFVGVPLLNRFEVVREKTESGAIVDFTVPASPPQPEKRERPPEQKRIIKSDQPALAPLPNVGGSLSGIVVEMPEYTPGGVTEVSESILGDLDKDIVMTEDSVDKKPVVRTRSLEYPERAKQRDIEGKVVVSVLIGTDGRVKNMKILESNPPGVFDEAVLRSVPRWTFDPAQYKNRSVKVWATIPIDFSLR